MAPVFQSTDAGSGSDAMASSAVAVAAFAPTCVEHQTRQRNHPRHRAMDTSRIDGVKSTMGRRDPRVSSISPPRRGSSALVLLPSLARLWWVLRPARAAAPCRAPFGWLRAAGASSLRKVPGARRRTVVRARGRRASPARRSSPPVQAWARAGPPHYTVAGRRRSASPSGFFFGLFLCVGDGVLRGSEACSDTSCPLFETSGRVAPSDFGSFWCAAESCLYSDARRRGSYRTCSADKQLSKDPARLRLLDLERAYR